MEVLQTLKLPIEMARYAGHQLLGGAWGELGDQYGVATGGHLAHQPTIGAPALRLAAAPEAGQGYYLPPTEAA